MIEEIVGALEDINWNQDFTAQLNSHVMTCHTRCVNWHCLFILCIVVWCDALSEKICMSSQNPLRQVTLPPPH